MKQSPVYWLDYDGNVTSQRGNGGNPCMKLAVGLIHGSNALRPSIELFGLIDTGCDTTSFTPAIYHAIGSRSHESRAMFGNYGTSMVPRHDVGFIVENTGTIFEGSCGVFDVGPHPLPYSCIIGRDVLQYGRLILDTELSDSEMIWRAGPFTTL